MKVLLVDDHALFAESLALALSHHDERFEVSIRLDISGAIEYLMRNVAQLIILDLDLADESGLDILDKLAIICSHSRPPILLCSAHQRPVSIAKAFVKGVRGFVSKEQSVDEFYQATTAVIAGNRYCFPALAKKVEKLEFSIRCPEGLGKLNTRYIEILRFLADGQSNRDIAHRLSMSENTVKAYLKDLYAIMGVRSRMACVCKAVSVGLIDFL